MEILSPLTKFLRLPQGSVVPRSSRVPTEPSSSPSKPSMVHKSASPLAKHGLFSQLYALPPKDLQKFVSQHLPFLNDPFFAQRLARMLGGAESHRSMFDNVSRRQISESHVVRNQAGEFWKVWHVPIVFEGRLCKVSICLSQTPKKRKRKGYDNQRIILATDWEHTGPIEIEAGVFDNALFLALRTTRAFSFSWQAGIRERFEQILEAVRMRGSINFYTVSKLSTDTLEMPTAWEMEL